MSKNKNTPSHPRRGGIRRKTSRKIREYFYEDDHQYMGGKHDDFYNEEGIDMTSDTVLNAAEKFICLYQIIGQCYYVACAFHYKGQSPFAAQILTGAVSFAVDLYV